MSEKQDRTYARTAQDIERKYSFGKTFADMLGLINDNRDKVDSVESYLGRTEHSTTLKRDTEEIVMSAEKRLEGSIAGVDNEVSALSSKVEMKLDADAVNFAIESKLGEGVTQVVTSAGYRFDAEGLNISQTGTEMSNSLTADGMYVKRSGEDILTANSLGVSAVDLHAKTYLTVGEGEGRSRFEDYGINRTGCFWVGG